MKIGKISKTSAKERNKVPGSNWKIAWEDKSQSFFTNRRDAEIVLKRDIKNKIRDAIRRNRKW